MSVDISQELIKAGYRIEEHARGRYIQGLIRLAGGIGNMDFLRDVYMIRLLSNAQLRKEKAFTYKQLQQIALPEAHTDRFYGQMEMLIANGMFLRGYNLQCPTCDLETWYSLNDIEEHTVCQGCRLAFQLPLTLSFSYRPNRLLVEALKSGAITILLTGLWLREQFDIRQWQSEMMVSRGDLTTDLDIVYASGDQITIIECKDNFKVTEIDSLKQQLSNGIRVAEDIGAEYYIFATLYPDALPQELIEWFHNQSTKLQVKILTRDDFLGT